ncbi:hypothetical protein COB55_01290 [Candidatus Wolfebacteria bacterium]|nr:MAG: hypothetical protein COB55_01290 [Candidatus Wolfebacteria bacterium]
MTPEETKNREAMEEFFGDIPAIKKKLARALQDARKLRDMTCDDLDQECRFDGILDPLTCEFERNPTKLTRQVYQRAAKVFGIVLEKVLPLEKFLGDRSNVATLVKEMKSTGSRLLTATGGSGAKRIPLQERVRTYLGLQILKALGTP